MTISKRNPENLVIRLASESWETILNNYAKYFDSIYGEKYVTFLKLAEIRRITSKNLSRLRPPTTPALTRTQPHLLQVKGGWA